MSDLAKRFGKRVRALRQGLRLSRAELAAAVGVRAPAVAKIERGERMNARQLERLAEALGVTVADLFTDSGDGPPAIAEIVALVKQQSQRDPQFPDVVLRVVRALLPTK